MGNFFMFLLLSADFLINFLKESFKNTVRASNILNQDHLQHFVCPDLGPNYLQMLSVNDKNCC